MHDPRTLLEMGDAAVSRLARRGYHLDVKELETLFSRRTSSITRTDMLRTESKRVTEQVQRAARGQGGDVSELKERARELKEQIRAADAEREHAAAELRGE